MASTTFRGPTLIAICVAGLLGSGAAGAQSVSASDAPPAPAPAIDQDASAPAATDQAPAAAGAAEKKKFVQRRCLQYTGSRIKAYDSTTGKRPCIAGPGSAYSKDDIDRTGQADLGRALKQLDPSIKSN